MNIPMAGCTIWIWVGVLHLLTITEMYGFGLMIMDGYGPMVPHGPTSTAMRHPVGCIYLFGRVAQLSSLTRCMVPLCT
jgi:hypothetical protein